MKFSKKFLLLFIFVLLLVLLGTSSLCASESDFKVVVLTSRKLTTPADLSTWDGIVKLRTELGLDVKIIECVEIAEYKEQVHAVSEEGYNVVYFIYDVFLTAVQEIASQYPETMYIGLWIEIPEEKQQPNIKPLFFRPNQGSFFGGIVAAEVSKTGKVGFIGGGINPGILQFLAGFEAGLKSSGRDVELITSWAGTFEDPFKGRELALSLYNRGVDVIYQVANQTGLGVIMAAKEVGKYVIGVDVDQSYLAPDNVVASVLLDHGYATYDSIRQAYEGQFTPSQVYYGLNEGMPVIALTDNIPDDIKLKVEAVKQKVIAGEIEIPTTTTTR